MRILCLYHNECALELFDWLGRQGNQTVCCSKELIPQWCVDQRFDLTVSYTYRYILTKEMLEVMARELKAAVGLL